MAILTPKNLNQKYKEAKAYHQETAGNYYEFQRHRLGMPADTIPEGTAPISEGTIMTLLQELPVKVLPDTPTYKISMGDKVKETILEFIFNKIVIPQANTNAPFHIKCQMLIQNAATYGLQMAEIFYKTDERNRFLPDFRLPYPSYTIMDKEAASAYDSDYFFITQLYSPSNIDVLIGQEEQRRINGDKRIFSITKLRAAKKIKSSHQRDDTEPYVVQNKNSDGAQDQIVIVKAIARDVEAKKSRKTKIYYFVPDTDLGVIGTEELGDYYGLMPVVPFYHQVVLDKPYGHGIAEQLNGDQNSLDEQKGLALTGFTLRYAPPLMIHNIDEDSIDLNPYHIIRSNGEDNAAIAPLDLAEKGLDDYQTQQAYARTLMHRKVGSQETGTIVPEGTASGSKTAAGVRSQQARLSRNYARIRKDFEFGVSTIFLLWTYSWLFNRNDKEDLEVDTETFNKIAKYASKSDLKSLTIKGKKNVIKVDWSDYDADLIESVYMKVETGWAVDDAERLEQSLQLFSIIREDPDLRYHVNLRNLLEDVTQLMGLDEQHILLPPDEVPTAKAMTEPEVRKLIDEVAGQLISKARSEDQVKAEDMPSQTLKALIQQKTGIPATGTMPADADRALEKRKLDQEDKKLALEELKIRLDYQAKLAASEGTPETPAISEAPVTPEAPANPTGQRPPEEVGQLMAEVLAEIQAKGANDEQTQRMVLLLEQLDQPNLTKEVYDQVSKEIDQLLAEIEGE